MSIDESNPNTRRLVEYWVHGEGAVKVRWGTDGSFDRCVRHLSDKVRDPKGLCAELHKKATGEWPAEKGVESALEAETFELTDAEVKAALPRQPVLTWRGPIAPINRLTGDRREFAAGALDHRDFPLPVMFQVATGTGHGNAVTVATLDGFSEVGDLVEGYGRFLDPRIVPEVTRAIYLIKEGVAGPSVDLEPDMTYEIIEGPSSSKSTFRVTKGKVIGVTFVSKPAFANLKIQVHDADVQAVLASAGMELELTEYDEPDLTTFAVNGSSWTSMPLGERDQPFDADNAIKRLIQVSGGNPTTFSKAFLWRQTDGDPKNKDSYRLPVADVINGKMTLVPHAVYAAAALLSGAHGGLPNVPDNEKEQIRNVITKIYDMLRDTFSDPRIVPMWQRGGRQGATGTGTQGVQASASEEDTVDSLTAATQGWKPPAAWFRNPDLTKPTGLTVTDDGRVYGHLASWNVCHTGIGNQCVTAPHSVTDYRHFKVGTVVTDDGQNLAVGKITLGGGHASPQYGIKPALDHYDNAGAAVAAINVGEDGHGVWVAGALMPGVDDTRVAQLRLSPLSGDWRRVDGNLELIAALAVNTPGFPVLRASAASDEPEVLLAAGVVEQPTADFVTAEPKPEAILIRLQEIDAFLESTAKAERAERVRRVLED